MCFCFKTRGNWEDILVCGGIIDTLENLGVSVIQTQVSFPNIITDSNDLFPGDAGLSLK